MKKSLWTLVMLLAAAPAWAQTTTLYSNSTTGDVGIGTTSPANLLDLGTGGGMHITSGVPSSTTMALYNNAGTLMWNGTTLGTGSSVSGTTNYIPVFTGSSSLGNSVMYQSGSNIGIGTTSPSAPLHVNHTLPTGTISSSGTTVTGSGSNFTSAFAVGDVIIAGAQVQTISAISNDTVLTTSSGFSPALNSGTSYQRLGAILNAGFVGIGTTTPFLPLDIWATPAINGDDRAVADFGDNSSMAANVGGGIEFSGHYNTAGIPEAEWAGIKSGKANGTSGDYGAYLAFETRTNGSATTERMRIDSLGNVGIGTLSPAARLDVNGHIANSGSTVSVSSCGASPTVNGNDTRGLVNTGSGTVTSCVVTFASAYSSNPFCVAVFSGSSAISTGLAVSTSTTTLTLHFTASCAPCGVSYYCSQ